MAELSVVGRSIAAAIAIFRFKVGMIPTLAGVLHRRRRSLSRWSDLMSGRAIALRAISAALPWSEDR
jgi:hypothetical protein